MKRRKRFVAAVVLLIAVSLCAFLVLVQFAPEKIGLAPDERPWTVVYVRYKFVEKDNTATSQPTELFKQPPQVMDSLIGSTGIFISKDKVITGAGALGWHRPLNYSISPRMSSFLFDDRTKIPVQWIVKFGSREYNAFPVLSMPKSYGIVILQVQGLTVESYPKIAESRPKEGEPIWLIASLLRARPRRAELLDSKFKAVVVDPEVKHKRTFANWDTNFYREFNIRLILAEVLRRKGRILTCENGTPVVNRRGELCGIVSDCWDFEFEEEDGRKIKFHDILIEPIDEIKDEIRSVLGAPSATES